MSKFRALPDGGRGSGRTTRAMLAAPKGAYYIWCGGSLDYPRELARKLGREDLKIVGPDWLTARRYQGLTGLQLRVDHYAPLTDAQWQEWLHAKLYERIRTPLKKP